METIDWSQIITNLLTGAGNVILGGISGAIAGWLTYIFGARRDEQKLRNELREERKRTLINHRDQAIDGIWKAVRIALERASIATAMYKQYPDFKRLSSEATNEIIENSRLTESQKSEFYASYDKNKYYKNAVFWSDLNEARKTLYDLNTLFLDNKIYIPEDLSHSISGLIEALRDTYLSYEIWYESEEPQLMMRAREEIQLAQDHAKAIVVKIRELLSRQVEDG